MGSAAMDKAGDIGIGYSASSGSIHPAIRYTGRTTADPLGTMEAETSMLEGGGSQTNGLTRWGDYSALRIDPSDDCTFWYATEYIPSDGAFNWRTLIGSFSFSTCGGGGGGGNTGDFSIVASPSSLSTLRGGSPAATTVTVSSLNGYTNPVGLTASGCPTGATCTVSPSSVTPGANGPASASATLTVTTTSSTPEGSYSIVVSGTDGTLTHTTTVSLTVKVDFTIGPISPGPIVVSRGTSGALPVPVGQAGQGSTSVNLTVSGLPNRTSATFNPASVTSGGSSTLTLSANNGAQRGTYQVTVTGKNASGFAHTATFSLTVQ